MWADKSCTLIRFPEPAAEIFPRSQMSSLALLGIQGKTKRTIAFSELALDHDRSFVLRKNQPLLSAGWDKLGIMLLASVALSNVWECQGSSLRRLCQGKHDREVTGKVCKDSAPRPHLPSKEGQAKTW